MNNPGQYLKSIRKKLGLGVKAVYMQTGVGDSTIRRIEEGTTKFPPAAQLKALANFYNINLIELSMTCHPLQLHHIIHQKDYS